MNPVRYPRGVQQAGEKGEAAHQRLLHLWREEEGTEKEIKKKKNSSKLHPKLEAGLLIRIHLLRIRIQLFFSMRIQILVHLKCGSGSSLKT